MAAPNRCRVTLTDLNNQNAVVLFYNSDNVNANITQVANDIAACSKGFKSRTTKEVDLFGPSVGTGSTGAYGTILDVAIFLFRCADGSAMSIVVPEPKQAIFTSDNETVDPAQPNAAALITDAMAHVTTKNGITLTGFTRGYRSRLTTAV